MNHAAATASTTTANARKSAAAPLPDELRGQLEALFSRVGLTGAADALNISPNALARALAHAPVSRGTVASIKLALQESAR